jgi:hypothetical protein
VTWAAEEASDGFAAGNWYVSFGDSNSIESEGCFSEERARLIAAAPDLLEALRTIAYEPIGPSDASASFVLRGIEDIARAAIAKAEGR